MPTAVAKKKPATKRSHASQNRQPTKAQVDAELKKHLDFLKEDIGRKFTAWRKSNPSVNLGDLLQYLERVQDELLAFNYDDVLAEIEGELSDAAEWLGSWGPIEVHVADDGEPATVEYRLADVEEDIGEVEELIEALGESFGVKRLPKWKPRAKAA